MTLREYLETHGVTQSALNLDLHQINEFSISLKDGYLMIKTNLEGQGISDVRVPLERRSTYQTSKQSTKQIGTSNPGLRNIDSKIVSRQEESIQATRVA